MKRIRLLKTLGKLLLLMLLPLLSTAQNQRVTGKVFDEKGEPLPGASVKLKVTGTSTSTDVNGAFSLEAAAGDQVLVVSFVGYTAKEVAIVRSGAMSITLQPESKGLDEVVVVGYG